MAMRAERETVNGAADWPWAALTAAAGIAFVVLVVVGIVLSGEEPDPGDPVDEIRAYFVDDRGTVLAAAYLDSLASAFLLAFAAGLGGLVRRSGADPWGILSRLMVGGAAATAALALVGNLARGALAYRGAEAEPATVRALFDLYALPLVFVPLAAFLVAAGAGVLRSAIVPRWLGWVALVAAAASLIGAASLGDPRGPVSFVGFLGGLVLFGLWTLAVCALLLIRRGAAAPVAGTHPV